MKHHPPRAQAASATGMQRWTPQPHRTNYLNVFPNHLPMEHGQICEATALTTVILKTVAHKGSTRPKVKVLISLAVIELSGFLLERREDFEAII